MAAETREHFLEGTSVGRGKNRRGGDEIRRHSATLVGLPVSSTYFQVRLADPDSYLKVGVVVIWVFRLPCTSIPGSSMNWQAARAMVPACSPAALKHLLQDLVGKQAETKGKMMEFSWRPCPGLLSSALGPPVLDSRR